MSAPAPDPGFDPARRRAELAKIHIGARQLLAGEEEYRDMLEAITGSRSAGALDAAGRRKVLDHLKACGATFAPPRRPARARPEAESDCHWQDWEQLQGERVVAIEDAGADSAWTRPGEVVWEEGEL